MHTIKLVIAAILSLSRTAFAEDKHPVIYLQPNTTQVFTELYQAYGLLSPPERTFFENALYMDQSTIPSILPMQPSNQAILEHADQVLSEYHRRVGDFELYIDPTKPEPFFYKAVGSKHLLVALAYAIATSESDKKFVFAEFLDLTKTFLDLPETGKALRQDARKV